MLIRDHAVRIGVVRSSPMGFVPAGCKLVAESQGQCKLRAQTDDIFGIKRAEQRTPAERSGGGIEQKTTDGPFQEGLQAGERGLSVLAQREILVRLEALEPRSRSKLMTAFRKRDSVLVSEQVSS